MLVAIFGIDGSGKTTAGKGLAAHLATRSINARYSKLVDANTPFVDYYKLLVEEDARFAGDGVAQNYAFVFERHRTAEALLKPLLKRHDIVVLDRYVHCDIAYSDARGRPSEMYDRLLDHVPQVDVGFVMDLPVEVAMTRVTMRGEPIWTFQENLDLLARVREQYLSVAGRFGFTVIDAERDRDSIVGAMCDKLRDHPVFGLRMPA